MKLAIIGTAGRKEDATRLASNPKLYYTRMLDCARYVAKLVGADTLVSGGAAWADMCAVLLFLEQPDSYKLELELPAELVSDSYVGCAYLDTGKRDWITNPGGTCNFYLRSYSSQCRDFTDSSFPWSELARAKAHSGASLRVTPGFKERNLKVAKADHCLAMTFGEGAKLKDGGTAHTMGAFLARKGHGRSFHFDLTTLRFYEGATI